MLSVEKVFVTIQYCVNPATAGYTRGVVASVVDCRWHLTSNVLFAQVTPVRAERLVYGNISGM